jgi:hypothetical protein
MVEISGNKTCKLSANKTIKATEAAISSNINIVDINMRPRAPYAAPAISAMTEGRKVNTSVSINNRSCAKQ